MNVETQTHLTTLRELLLYRVHELEAEVHAAVLQGDGDAGAEERPDVVDRKDEAEVARRAALRSEAERIARAALAACRGAMKRLDDGGYGGCRDCGEPIPLARLLVQPQAERCAHCQAAFERVHPTAA